MRAMLHGKTKGKGCNVMSVDREPDISFISRKPIELAIIIKGGSVTPGVNKI